MGKTPSWTAAQHKEQKQLRDIIAKMPAGLEHAYEQDWHYKQFHIEDRERAINILRWVTFARRPLCVGELVEALITSNSDVSDDYPMEELPDAIDEDYVLNELLGPCGSLLELRKGVRKECLFEQHIGLAHSSVREFLQFKLSQNCPINYPSFVDNQLSGICLRYLGYSQVWATKTDKERAGFNSFFLDYAVRFWFTHISDAGSNFPELSSTIKEFFRSDNEHWSRWCESFEHGLHQDECDDDQENDMVLDCNSRKHYAAVLGLKDVMEMLLEENGSEVDDVQGRYGTILQTTCRVGAFDCVQSIVNRGANVNFPSGEFGSAINAASWSGWQNIVSYLISKWAELSIRSPSGFDALMYSAQAGHADIVRRLLESGAEFSCRDDFGRTPVFWAAANGHGLVIKLLHSYGAKLHLQDNQGEIALRDAARRGEPEVVRLILDLDGNLSPRSDSAQEALLWAVESQKLQLVELMLDRGYSVGAKDSRSMSLTPLHLAAYLGSLDIAQFLVQHGADCWAKEVRGSNPLHVAALGGHTRVVEFLLSSQVNVDVRNNFDETPLHLAASKGHLACIQHLVHRGANVNARDEEGFTAMHFSAYSGNVDVMRVLHDHGANCGNCGNSAAARPLRFAAQQGHVNVLEFLHSLGEDLGVQCNNGQTSMHLAAKEGHIVAVRFLMDRGVDRFIPDKGGRNALLMAAERGHTALLRLLLNRGVNSHGRGKSEVTSFVKVALGYP